MMHFSDIFHFNWRLQLLAPTSALAVDSRRDLSVHEYISYNLLETAGIPTPKAEVAKTSQQAYEIAKSLGGSSLDAELHGM